ncbi:hypothetical protein [Leisingera sp. ANG59]|uniref:hypothetical protein n=1 Tax=Leisingera sp. ANG59 TaxID=2675221 RepID=UPI0015745FEA|nr:hypothetical protein [Leisingera sp. ANG59]NSY37730.1 hypothetical protein [Leisingera sp. ANG59]
MNACRLGPSLSRAKGAGAAFGATLPLVAVFASDLDFYYPKLAADLYPLTTARRLPRTGKGHLQCQQENRAQPRQPPEKAGAASGRYEKGARHLLQDSLAAFAADTTGNISAVI